MCYMTYSSSMGLGIQKFEDFIFKIKNFTILHLKRIVGEWMMYPIKIPWFNCQSVNYLVRICSNIPSIFPGGALLRTWSCPHT
ncbi:hypothetical protein KFK09_009579 [Dendrobium nobile]|uniref:Uncharacterized protein n=1 Tax=Dendrobium nobile TaxID=94219 RepID=A0A8T3BHV0_DENNO|nr:hypothetical protein KFK09_009579 [Dendrobium nobile]